MVMAREKMPFATQISSKSAARGVYPVSANVTVPLDNPALKAEIQGYGSLASRLNTFSETAFKQAGALAKSAGYVYGVSNAPTFQDVDNAAKTNTPVEVQGSLGSLRIFDQAVYQGQMAIVESHFSTAAQKAMTDVFVNADKTQATPKAFLQSLQSVVTNYTNQLSNIDKLSGAKLSSKLGTLANGKYVEYSRAFVKAEKKALMDGAIVAADDWTEKNLDSLIFGYKVELDENNNQTNPPLDEILSAQILSQLNGLAANGVGIQKRDDLYEKMQAKILEGKIEFIVRLGHNLQSTSPEEDVQKIIAKLWARKADPTAQHIFDSLKPKEKRQAAKTLLGVGSDAKAELIDKDDEVTQAHKNTFNAIQDEIYSNTKTFDVLVKRIRDSGLPGTSNDSWNKKALMSELRAFVNQQKTGGSKSEPTDAEINIFEEMLKRARLSDTDPNRLTPDKLRRLGIKGVGLPVTGNGGVNFSKLHELVQKFDADYDAAVKVDMDLFLKELKSKLTTKDIGKNQAGNRLYNEAAAQFYEIVEKARVGGTPGEAKLNEFFDTKSDRRRRFMQHWVNKLPGLERQMQGRINKLEGIPPKIPNQIPVEQALKQLRYLYDGGKWEAARNYMNKPAVYGMTIQKGAFVRNTGWSGHIQVQRILNDMFNP